MFKDTTNGNLNSSLNCLETPEAVRLKSSSNKVVFLDIDGPMIPYRCLVMPKQTPVMTLFDPVAVSLLNHLCEEHDLCIVVHSSWVRIMGGEATVEHCIKQGIKEENFHLDAHTTEDLNWRYSRVADWLSKHPEVTDYAIVDDDPYKPDEFGFKHPEGIASKIVLVDYYDGFMFSTYNEILSKFK